MAKLALSRVFCPLFQGLWKGATSPSVFTSHIVERLDSSSQQQRVRCFKTSYGSISSSPSILPCSFTFVAQRDVSSSECDIGHSLSQSITGRRAVRFPSTVSAAAEKAKTQRATQRYGKTKEQGGAIACRGESPNDLKGSTSSYVAKSPRHRSPAARFADRSARRKQGASSAIGASPGDGLQRGFSKQEGIFQEPVVHGPLRGTGDGAGKREGGAGAHPEAGLKQTVTDRDDEEVERICREDYWKLKERTSADFSTHPPYMYPMDPEMQPKGPPLSPHTRQKRPLK